MHKILWFCLLFVVACSDHEKSPEQNKEDGSIATSLPFQSILLNDMSDFQEQKGNWQIVGGCTSDLQESLQLSIEEGSGILANLPSEELNSNLISKLEHGDLEIKFEVMMPKGSNSGVYFQGRYEIQMLDSWGKDEIGPGDMGGIYERWDDSKPDGQKGYEGSAPKVNASRAPGLWQSFHVLFKAPKFDDQGVKKQNARFEYVYHNGHQIHTDVELTGPTRGAGFDQEAEKGPLLIQGDHGPVAYRNVRYKSYENDTLQLENITYEFFKGKWDYIPDYDSVQLAGTGEVDFFDLETITDQPNGYGVVFKGDLFVPIAGEYLFETMIDDGGDLYIDSTLVIHNQGDPGMGHESGLLQLTEGTHQFEISFYQEVWAATLLVYYEGPGIERRALACTDVIAARRKKQMSRPRLLVNNLEKPELLRGFTSHGDDNLSHTIAVGHPEGLHYSYDLRDGTMVQSWKGQFADVTDMWRGRGSQFTKPLNATVEFSRGIPVAQLSSESASWPAYRPDDFKYRGYSMDEQSLPTFEYNVLGMTVFDRIRPIEDGRKLRRTLDFKKEKEGKNLYYKIGHANSISKLSADLYSIGGSYYIQSGQDLVLRQLENHDELLMAVNTGNSYNYNILW